MTCLIIDRPCGVQAEVRELEAAVDRAEGDVDFFLTFEWPANVTALCAPGSVPDALDSSGTESSDLNMADHGSVGVCLQPSLSPRGCATALALLQAMRRWQTSR